MFAFAFAILHSDCPDRERAECFCCCAVVSVLFSSVRYCGLVYGMQNFAISGHTHLFFCFIFFYYFNDSIKRSQA